LADKRQLKTASFQKYLPYLDGVRLTIELCKNTHELIEVYLIILHIFDVYRR
jgi:hypothetical protein